MPRIRNQQTVTVTAADTLLIGGNMRRVGLILSPPHTADVWVSFVGQAAVGVGLRLAPGMTWITLTDDWIGEAIVEEIRAISSGGAEVIGVLEVMD